jgi:hypothetical protein
MEPANAGNASAPNAAIVLKQQPGRPIMNRAPGDAGETFKRATALLAEAADRLSHADLPRFVQECRLLGVDEIEVGTWTDEILATEYAISDGEERAQILLLQKLFIDAPPQTSVAAPAADIDKVVAHDGKAVGVLAGTPPRSDAKQQPAQKKVQEEAKPLVHGHVAGHLLINDLHGNVHIGKATGVMHVSLIDLSAQPGAPAGAAGPEHKNDLPALGSLNLGDVGGSVHIAEVAGTIAVTGAIQGGHIVVADSQITAVHITHVAAKKAPGAGPKESVAAVSQDGSAVDQAGLHIESNGTGDRPPVINVGGIQGTNVDVIGYIHRMLAGKK